MSDVDTTSKIPLKEHVFYSIEWGKQYANCRMALASGDKKWFYNEVITFLEILVDLKGGAKIRTKLTKYYEEEWIPMCEEQLYFWCLNNQYAAGNYKNIGHERFEIRTDIKNSKLLFTEIIQTIEDSGLGFNASSYDIGDL